MKTRIFAVSLLFLLANSLVSARRQVKDPVIRPGHKKIPKEVRQREEEKRQLFAQTRENLINMLVNDKSNLSPVELVKQNKDIAKVFELYQKLNSKGMHDDPTPISEVQKDRKLKTLLGSDRVEIDANKKFKDAEMFKNSPFFKMMKSERRRYLSNEFDKKTPTSTKQSSSKLRNMPDKGVAEFSQIPVYGLRHKKDVSRSNLPKGESSIGYKDPASKMAKPALYSQKSRTPTEEQDYLRDEDDANWDVDGEEDTEEDFAQQKEQELDRTDNGNYFIGKREKEDDFDKADDGLDDADNEDHNGMDREDDFDEDDYELDDVIDEDDYDDIDSEEDSVDEELLDDEDEDYDTDSDEEFEEVEEE